MRHIYYAITICTAASLGLGFGQDIPTDTFKALAEEWKTPATTLNCLTALRLYTTYTVKEGDVFLSPARCAPASMCSMLFLRNRDMDRHSSGTHDVRKIDRKPAILSERS